MLGVRNPLLEAVLKPGYGIVSKKNTAKRLADKLESCQSGERLRADLDSSFGLRSLLLLVYAQQNAIELRLLRVVPAKGLRSDHD